MAWFKEVEINGLLQLCSSSLQRFCGSGALIKEDLLLILLLPFTKIVSCANGRESGCSIFGVLLILDIFILTFNPKLYKYTTNVSMLNV